MHLPRTYRRKVQVSSWFNDQHKLNDGYVWANSKIIFSETGTPDADVPFDGNVGEEHEGMIKCRQGTVFLETVRTVSC